ncbi:MAG TPA: ribonuclease Z, partial [Cyclobacteriaceae bacterium]|nr:ribonuclease Z [Cyclobacteriaceae bacterium]
TISSQSQFKLTVLGSSAALPAYGRFPSAHWVEIQNQHFLIDCGEGTQMQIMRFQLPYHKLNHIFISHLHGDHYLGLTGLLFTMHLQQRTHDLHLYSQRGLDEILLLQLKYSSSVLHFKIIFHLIEPDQRKLIFEDSTVTIETIPLIHKISCTGFLFREKAKPRRIDKGRLQEGMLLQHIALLKTGVDIMGPSGNVLYKNTDFTLPPKHSYSYAYCSDTAYSEKIIDQIRGIDLLYHEATFLEDEKDKALETKHSTAAQAAAIAKAAGVNTLMIGHFSARYRELETALSEAQSIFPSTVLAIEGKILELDA